jgi:hypothetical protein
LEGYFAKELIELLSENGNKKCWWWGKTKSLLVPQANIIKQREGFYPKKDFWLVERKFL